MKDSVECLLDTNIVSETRKRRPEPGVTHFLEAASPEALFLSVLTLGELRKGIQIRRCTDAKGADLLAIWVDELEDAFGKRILPVDLTVARLWGQLSADRTRPAIDTLIAATALAHGLTLVTRNVKDFAGIAVPLLNPWQVIPSS